MLATAGAAAFSNPDCAMQCLQKKGSGIESIDVWFVLEGGKGTALSLSLLSRAPLAAAQILSLSTHVHLRKQKKHSSLLLSVLLPSSPPPSR